MKGLIPPRVLHDADLESTVRILMLIQVYFRTCTAC